MATAYLDGAAGVVKDADISHRGGHPGFAHIKGNTLIVPDFAGNGYFSIFGNIEVNPRTGLLFVDFEQGNLLYLTGRTEVIWGGDPDIAAYAGTARLFKCHLTQGIRVEGSLPLPWSVPEYSRFLAETGSW